MSRFETCLTFTWLPQYDGQPLHVTPDDPGGATAWGVTLATYSDWRASQGIRSTTQADLAAATKGELSQLIRELFWNSVQGDHLPVGVDLLVYDFGFGAGPGTSAKLLQEVIGGLQPDGQLGPLTLAAAARFDRLDLVRRLGVRHESYYASLPTFSEFGRGWTSRNSARVAMALATPAAASPTVAPPKPTSPQPTWSWFERVFG